MVAADVETGRLVPWGRVVGRVVEVWVLHPSQRLAGAKVSAFADFPCAAFPDRTLRPA